MRQMNRIAFALAGALAAFTLWAVEVSPEQAKTAAQNWIRISPNRMDSEFLSVDAESPKTVRTKTGRAIYHAVNLEGGGFVVTSGDTRLSPIIAFSATGRFSGDEGPLHALLKKDLASAVSSFERSDRKVAASGAGGAVANPYSAAMAEWAELLPAKSASVDSGRKYANSGSQKTSVSDVRVNKLCKTQWHQWANVYNYYMPGYAAGCVATAGAQIMKRWQQPKGDVAQFSNKCTVDGESTTKKSLSGAFDWDNMFLTYDPYNPPSTTQLKAVGKLMYNVGVAVGMDWTPGSSSADPVAMIEALKTRFGYRSGVHIFHDIDALNHSGSGTPADFDARLDDFNNALYASLDAKMPVLLSIVGRNSDGYRLAHAIVADGYGYTSGRRYTHLNFGWNGAEDAWYYIVNESCTFDDDYGVNEDYYEFEGIGFNIHPTESGDVVSGRVLDASGAAVSGAMVTLYDSSNSEMESVTTDSKGIYSFRIKAVGSYTILATHGSTDETPENTVDMPYLSSDGSYGYDGRTGNKWGVDVQFAKWTIPAKRKLTLKSSSSSRGTVSGGGKYMAGKKVTMKAKRKGTNVFAGWFKDKSCKKKLNPAGYDNRKPTVKIVMPSVNTTFYAKFVSKSSDKKSLKFSSATKKLAKTAAKATAGEPFTIKLGISSASLPTVTAKSLPKGLSINKTTGVITGTPTKPGSYTATVTVKSAAGNKITQKVKFKVAAPYWSRGNFYGVAKIGGSEYYNARVNYSVNAYGKIEGEVVYKDDYYSFASAYTSCTGEKAKFKVETKFGSKTFKSGTMTVLPMLGWENLGLYVATADSSKGIFWAEKGTKLLKSGNPLADLHYKSLTFTRDTPNSGLVKANDELTVRFMYAGDDFLDVTGTVNGKELRFSRMIPLALLYPYDGEYTFEAVIIDDTSKYSRILAISVTDGGVETQFIPYED